MRRLLSTCAVLAALAGGVHAPATPETCAKRLNIHYTYEDGATERLNAFQACTGGK
jgi:hypothetical protein